MNVFLVNQDHPAANSLVKKLSKGSSKNGAIIPLTSDEMDLYTSDGFQIIKLGEEGNKMMFEIDPKKCYVFVIEDKNVNISDIQDFAKSVGLMYGIIRTRKGH